MAASLSPPLADRLVEQHPGRHRDVQAFDGAPHRHAQQEVAVLPRQAAQARLPRPARAPGARSARLEQLLPPSSAVPEIQIPPPSVRSVARDSRPAQSGTVSAAPAATLRTAGVRPAARSRGATTAFAPAASAVRRHAPRLCGSCTPSSTSSSGGLVAPSAARATRFRRARPRRGPASAPWWPAPPRFLVERSRRRADRRARRSLAASSRNSRMRASSRPFCRAERSTPRAPRNRVRTACKPKTTSRLAHPARPCDAAPAADRTASPLRASSKSILRSSRSTSHEPHAQLIAEPRTRSRCAHRPGDAGRCSWKEIIARSALTCTSPSTCMLLDLHEQPEIDDAGDDRIELLAELVAHVFALEPATTAGSLRRRAARSRALLTERVHLARRLLEFRRPCRRARTWRIPRCTMRSG